MTPSHEFSYSGKIVLVLGGGLRYTEATAVFGRKYALYFRIIAEDGSRRKLNMKTRTNIRWLTQLALLVAILLVLNYTPLGYLQIGPLAASLLTVPVAIGAMTMGPTVGAILGGVFGLTSFLQAMQGKSAMSAALFQVSPVGSFVVCFVMRVLMGLCTGLIFAALCKAMPKQEKLNCFLGGLAAPLLNTVFFMGALVMLFYNCEFVQGLVVKLGAQNAFMFVVLLVGVQAVIEWCVCCVVAGAVALPVRKYLKTN